MAKVEFGSITVNSTGTKTPILSDSSLVVQRVVLFATSTTGECAAGYYDSSVTFTGSSAYQDESTTKTLTFYRNVGGTKTKVFEGIVTSLSTGEFSVSVTTLTESTSLKFVVYGV